MKLASILVAKTSLADIWHLLYVKTSDVLQTSTKPFEKQ